MRKILLMTAALVCIMLFTTACKSIDNNEHTKTWFAMDTFIQVTAYGENAAEAVETVQDEIFRLEELWSVTDEKSELYGLDHKGSGVVSDDTAELISFALDISEKSGGALDPTIYPVLSAWGFTTDNKRVPPSDEILRLLELVDYKAVDIFDNTVTLRDGMMLDLGAVAKGAASDKAAEILRKNNIRSALVNLGGNIMTVGTKPDGKDWRVGVKDPVGDGDIGILELHDCAAVTSGMYERYFIGENGTLYGHIIDPKNGYPVNNELISATVISPEGRLCDALSTAVFVMGADRAAELWRDMGGYDMLLITKDKEVIITDGIEERFTLTNKSLTLKVLGSDR